MDALAALLLSASHSPHGSRGHALGACLTYLSVGLILKPRKKSLNHHPIAWSLRQQIFSATLFAVGSVLQPSRPYPLTLSFLPLFITSFSDLNLSLLGGLCVFFARQSPLLIFRHILSTTSLGLLGAHRESLCIFAASLAHLAQIPFLGGAWLDGVYEGAYSAYARILFLRAAPLSLRGLLLLSPLSLLDLLWTESVPLLILPATLSPLFAKEGRDIFPFLLFPLSVLLAHQTSRAA